jgi:hypothetical protein
MVCPKRKMCALVTASCCNTSKKRRSQISQYLGTRVPRFTKIGRKWQKENFRNTLKFIALEKQRASNENAVPISHFLFPMFNREYAVRVDSSLQRMNIKTSTSNEEQHTDPISCRQELRTQL